MTNQSGNTIDDNIKHDPFVIKLLAKMPVSSRESFSGDQLLALKDALGARKWGQHRVDIRGTVSFWRWKYYYVFLAGRNRRPLSRSARELSTWVTAFMLALSWTAITLSGLLVLYLVKSALGIDIIPGFSLGIWSWFQTNVLH